MLYLCYDIRGIQTFIFRIPKLKYIIGGSALIDRFDRETMPGLDVPGCRLLFAGGGKGSFSCDSEKCASELQTRITGEAHCIGLDIRFGKNEDYSAASKNATELFPYIPEDLTGEPCPVSGLYPVMDGRPHPTVQKRLFSRGEKMFRWFEHRLLNADMLSPLPEEYGDAEFFGNVSATNDAGKRDAEGERGSAALGDRNRWAVICMDGNDMGSQMQIKIRELKDGTNAQEQMPRWIQTMS